MDDSGHFKYLVDPGINGRLKHDDTGRKVDKFNAPKAALIVLTWTAGTAMVMWLAELITQRGIGNGMSILIFASVVSRLPAQGGAIWHVLRTEQQAVAAHVSEEGLDVWHSDSAIRNDGSLDELHAQVERALAGELRFFLDKAATFNEEIQP